MINLGVILSINKSYSVI